MSDQNSKFWELKYLKYKNKYLNLKQIGGDGQSYHRLWDSYNPLITTLFEIVKRYYETISFDFLQNKVERELNNGNAGGPAVRARYDVGISSKDLARASIIGLRKLLTIKTIENAFEFNEKTKITDDSMLTDLAWHSLMLKPHKYYLITHTILDIVEQHIKNNIELTATRINKLMDDEKILTPRLVRHGTSSEIIIEYDIRDALKVLYKDDPSINEGYEWNMPMPLFP